MVDVERNRFLDEAFSRALSHILATKTPQDGGVVEAAVAALRDLWNHEAFQAAFAEKMAALPKK